MTPAILSLRVRDMARALAFYLGTLEFKLKRGGDAQTNCVVSRGDAELMLETAADHYGDEYNAAIRKRSVRRHPRPSTSKRPISLASRPDSKPRARTSSIL